MARGSLQLQRLQHTAVKGSLVVPSELPLGTGDACAEPLASVEIGAASAESHTPGFRRERRSSDGGW